MTHPPAMAVVALVLALLATPASAYVVETVVSMSTADAADPAMRDNATESTVEEILTKTIAFTPTIIRVLDAKVIGDRVYLFILVADEEGEKTIGALLGQRGGSTETPR